jgi:hypothetical protein
MPHDAIMMVGREIIIETVRKIFILLELFFIDDENKRYVYYVY